MLLEVDADGLLTAANACFFERTGYSDADLARLRWSSLLTAAGRLFYEAQLRPMIALNGSFEEVMLDIVGADGSRTPAIVNGRREHGAQGDSSQAPGLRLALMSVPDRKEYERQLQQARRYAEQASADSARVLRRLDIITRANAALARSLDLANALQELADVLVETFADWCIVYAPDSERAADTALWFAAHAEPARLPTVATLAELTRTRLDGEPFLSRLGSGDDGVLVERLADDDLHGRTVDPELVEVYRELRTGSLAVVPSRARGRRVAVLVLGRTRDRRSFGKDDLDDLTDVASRTGIAIDNLRLYAREHNASVALQRALLTEPLRHGRARMATRYLPAAVSSEVGGDWYDAFRQPNGAAVLVIGDVEGHDIVAAARMGQLRGVIRTVGHTLGGAPAAVLTRADQAAKGLQLRALASAVVARLVEPTELHADDSVLFEWSNAGHPAPVLVGADGTASLLDPGNDLMLGVLPSRARHTHQRRLHPGDTVVLYTDGLVERREEPIDVGMARLVAALDGSHDLDLEAVCDRVLSVASGRGEDDIALLAVRIAPSDRLD